MQIEAGISFALPLAFVAALAADLLFGDPEWLPHPVRWTGRAITFLEGVLRGPLRSPRGTRLAGVVLAVITAGGAYMASVAALYAASKVSTVILFIIAAYIIWTSISIKSLKEEAEGVLRPLVAGDLDRARSRLRRIVGRDTERLNAEGILKATAETIAENTSDGIVAPIFYLAIGGPALVLLSGYKNERYIDFGRASARLDDLANYVPSRLTATLMVAASFVSGQSWRRAIEVLLRDGRNHPSPNSGLPEAAMAGALGLKFGGPMSYGGVMHAKPHIGDDLKRIEPGAVTSGIRIMLVTSALMAASALAVLCAAIFLL